MKLISTTQLVLDLLKQNSPYYTEYLSKNRDISYEVWCLEKIQDHAKLLSKTPQISMFVACDECNKPLKKPIGYDIWLQKNKNSETTANLKSDAKFIEYYKAEQKILFKNWKYGKSEELNSAIDFLYTEDIKDWRERPHIGIESDNLHLSYLRETIENMVIDYKLELK